jgi:hypothetical protein
MIKNYDAVRVTMKTVNNRYHQRITVYYKGERNYVAWDLCTDGEYYIDDVGMDEEHMNTAPFISAATKITQKEPIGFHWINKDELMVLF